MNIRTLIASLVLSALGTQSNAMKISLDTLEDINPYCSSKAIQINSLPINSVEILSKNKIASKYFNEQVINRLSTPGKISLDTLEDINNDYSSKIMQITCPIQEFSIQYNTKTILKMQAEKLNLGSEEYLTRMSLKNLTITTDNAYENLLEYPKMLTDLYLENVSSTVVSKNFLKELNNLECLYIINTPFKPLLKVNRYENIELTKLNMLHVSNMILDDCPVFMSPLLKKLVLENVTFQGDAFQHWIKYNTKLEELILNDVKGYGSYNYLEEIFNFRNLKALTLKNVIDQDISSDRVESLMQRKLINLTELKSLTLDDKTKMALHNINSIIHTINIKRENIILLE